MCSCCFQGRALRILLTPARQEFFYQPRTFSITMVTSSELGIPAAGMSKNPRAVAVSLPSALRRGDGAGGEDTWQWRTDLASSQPHWRGWYDTLQTTDIRCVCSASFSPIPCKHAILAAQALSACSFHGAAHPCSADVSSLLSLPCVKANMGKEEGPCPC